MTDRSLRDAVAACETIAAGNNSTLFHAARLLPRHRRDVFSVAYAAMRVIDDIVDEEFLTLPPDVRDSQRPVIAARVEAWRRQTAENAIPGPLPELVARGFELVIRPSDLGPAPWDGLAAALQEDVAEAPMDDWAAFERYAEGATVAPAMIFIYLLGCREVPGGLKHGLPRSARFYAADLGVFCYLVHILRDLAKDVGAVGPDAPGPRLAQRLITIPTVALEAVGLSRATLADAVGQPGDVRLDRLAADMLARAETRRKAGRARLAELTPLLGPREKAAIEALVQVYEKLHRDFRKGYAERLRDLPGLEEPIRRAIFGT
jgi:presqualene diphosphate synthase